MLGGVSGEREQNWYPIGKVGWFTRHIREGIEVTAEQPGITTTVHVPLDGTLRLTDDCL